MLGTKKIIAIKVSSGTYSEFVRAILDFAKAKISAYVCVANVHMLVEAHNNPAFADVVNNADIVTPDGMPLVKAFKQLHGLNQDRVDGMTLLPILLDKCQEEGLPVFFYGGSQKMLDLTKAYLAQTYPTLKVAGLHSPPFRKLLEQEKQADADMIGKSGATLVFVVLGCPKQETWMAEMKGKIPAVMIGVGGALPVLVGLQKRAPAWMQKNSLEWVFRLMQEPKRLFNRYFTTNSTYLYLLAKEKLSKN